MMHVATKIDVVGYTAWYGQACHLHTRGSGARVFKRDVDKEGRKI